jgi:hypothetical protein
MRSAGLEPNLSRWKNWGYFRGYLHLAEFTREPKTALILL